MRGSTAGSGLSASGVWLLASGEKRPAHPDDADARRRAVKLAKRDAVARHADLSHAHRAAAARRRPRRENQRKGKS